MHCLNNASDYILRYWFRSTTGIFLDHGIVGIVPVCQMWCKLTAAGWSLKILQICIRIPTQHKMNS